MQQDEVEVGVGRRFAPPEPADGDERDAGHIGVLGHQLLQPGVVAAREFLAQRRTDESGPAQYAGPDLVQ